MGNLKIGARPATSVGDLLRWLGEHRALRRASQCTPLGYLP
jgi:hypothetical protein